MPTLDDLTKLYHPRVFGKVVLQREPYPAQAVVNLCPHPRQVTFCGRGVGKTSQMEGDNTARMASLQPIFDGLMHKSTKPIPMRIVIIGAVKDQAFELQQAIQSAFDRDSWLRSLKSVDTTKTHIVLQDGTRILIRAATNAARGQHAQTFMTPKGVVKGKIIVVIDEAAFIRQRDFFQEVVTPMLLMGGPGSQLRMFSTPYGQQGDAWDVYKRAGDCKQPYTLDAKGFRVYQFDKSLCRMCVAQNYAVRHNFASWENPHTDRKILLETKRNLVSQNREVVWDQEYRGVPSATAGLFFKPEDHDLMWDDGLPEYRVSRTGDFVERRLTTGGEPLEDIVRLDSLGNSRGSVWYLGADANQGIASRKCDYAALGLVEYTATHMAILRMGQRFKTAPPYFNGKDFRPGEVTPFMVELLAFLIRTFRVKKLYVDQGSGQAYYVPLVQMFGESVVEYVPTSVQAKASCLYHFRSIVQMNRFRAPRIRDLETETLYLRVDQDSIEEDKLRVSKAAAWGTEGAEVDGLFAVAYALIGTRGIAGSIGGSFVVPHSTVDRLGQRSLLLPHSGSRLILPVTRN
jgi:hypothetical protein